MNTVIKNRYSGAVIVEAGGYDSIREAVELTGADLYGADLSGTKLSGADLSGANLSGADLYGADLSGANLSGADLSGADLSGTKLSGADLSGTKLSGANLSGANLSGAELSGADLSGAELYSNSHDIFAELIRRNHTLFTSAEWAAIGQIVILRICWDTIIKRHKKPAMSIFKKLEKIGFGEYLTELTQKITSMTEAGREKEGGKP